MLGCQLAHFKALCVNMLNHPRPFQCRRAFSLLELILVLTVIGVLGGVVGVRLLSFGGQQSLYTHADLVQDQFMRQQERAMASGMHQRMTLNVDTGVLEMTQFNGNTWIAPGDKHVPRIELFAEKNNFRLSWLEGEADAHPTSSRATTEAQVMQWLFWADGSVEPSGTLHFEDGKYYVDLRIAGPAQGLDRQQGALQP